MKREGKNKVLAISLVVLSLTAIMLFAFLGQDEGVDKDIFKIENLSSVDRILFTSVRDTINLSFNGSRWLVNKDYNADDQLVTVLFATLQQAESKRRVAASLVDSVTQRIKLTGVKVELYQEDVVVKELYVGGNANKSETYFFDDSNGPYVMAIPGYRVYVAGVFEVETGGWRDKRIFNFNWRNFKKLKTTNLNQPNQNFEIEDNGYGFDLVNTAGTDTTRLNDYLDAVSLLMAKDFVKKGSNPIYDSISQTSPLVTIEVFDLGDNKHLLDLFAPIKEDPNVVGKLDDLDLVIFNRQQIFPVLKSRDYFMKKSP